MDTLLLQRALGGIYVPPIDVIDDRATMDAMLKAHIEQKNFLMALSTDEYVHEDILELVEAYIGTSAMDVYIADTEQKLDRVLE
jgi:hypothetical protein